jgi:hypothetical protein
MSQEPESLLTQNVKQFAIKASIAFILIVIASGYVLEEFHSWKYSVMSYFPKEVNYIPKEKNRVLLLSFIQNPAALDKLSMLDEKDGNFENAIAELELAIGLLEMHGADQKVIGRYETKLKELNSKMQASLPLD